MSYTIDEFNPSPIVIFLDDEEIEFSFITLHLETIINSKYNNLSEMFEKLDKDKKSILEMSWLFIKEKEKFNNKYYDFVKFCTSRNDLKAVGRNLTSGLYESVQKSRPEIKNAKRQKDIDAIKNTQDQNESCYARFFDSIAKRYGYTIEELYKLTLRQLNILLKTIGDESYKELEIEASLHGAKLKERMIYSEVTEEEEAEQDRQAQEALQELKNRMKKDN